MENSYFNEVLSNFTKDFAYGGAIRHLVDKGYTAERIIKEFNYPLSRESIEKMVNDYSQKNKPDDVPVQAFDSNRKEEGCC